MIKIARQLIPTILIPSVVLLTFAIAACGGGEETREDMPTATPAGETSSADSPTATPVAETQNTAQTSLDEYLMAVCGGQSEVTDWEEGVSIREISSGLGQHIEIMESLDPPSEVSDWHDAGLAFQRAFKETVDDYLEDPKGQSEDEFLLSSFLTAATNFQPVEQAIAGMDPDLRSRMIEAGCIDEETSGATPVQEDREEIPVGGSLAGSLDDPEETDIFQFQAEAGVEYVIEVAWQDIPEITVIVKDAPDPVAYSFQTLWAETSPLVVRWVAEESKTHHIDVFSGQGTGSYTVSVSIDASPDSPSGVSAAWDGASAITVSWDPVAGAEYYNVYHDMGGYACSLDGAGNPSWCDELAANVADTSYTHTSPSTLIPNHYWVVACNSDGCSAIDSGNPATPGEGPALQSPTNQQYAILGMGSQVRITWDAVDGADFYYVYHNNQPSCSVDDSSCEQLNREIGTMYFHTSPDPLENYYWVVACTFDECSEIDIENPAREEGETSASTGGSSVVSSPSADRAALVTLYHSTDGPNWERDRNWLSEEPTNRWYGVRTDWDGRVTELDLGGNGLRGEMPSDLGSLSNLVELNLPRNRLTGEIPVELGNLSNLTKLDLTNNELSGEIPPEFGGLTSLERLFLRGNQITGSIPAELGSLSNLGHLRLNHNQLSGTIPSELGWLTNLRILALYSNELSGEIPAELGRLTGLFHLGLSNNRLTGEIPPELGNLSSLSWLYLFGNQLSGEIPGELGALTDLERLQLQGNHLTGAIPPELGNLAKLEVLALHMNQLSGEIPDSLGALTNLERMFLQENRLSGPVPPELGRLTKLEVLALHGNQLSGVVPQALADLTNLIAITVCEFNQLSCEVAEVVGEGVAVGVDAVFGVGGVVGNTAGVLGGVVGDVGGALGDVVGGIFGGWW